jgi:hypothetical protein
MRMTDKPDDTADTNTTPSFAILASTTGTVYLSKLPAVLARMAWIGVSKLKFQWTKTSKAPTQDTLMLYCYTFLFCDIIITAMENSKN